MEVGEYFAKMRWLTFHGRPERDARTSKDIQRGHPRGPRPRWLWAVRVWIFDVLVWQAATSPRTIMDTGIPVVADSSSHSGGLHIPESKDGFFGYSEEKSLQQVIDSTIEWALLLIYPDRGEILGTASRVRVPFRSRQPQTLNLVARICDWRGRLSWGHRGRWPQAAHGSNPSSRSVKLSPKFLRYSSDSRVHRQFRTSQPPTVFEKVPGTTGQIHAQVPSTTWWRSTGLRRPISTIGRRLRRCFGCPPRFSSSWEASWTTVSTKHVQSMEDIPQTSASALALERQRSRKRRRYDQA